jgi:uncharacterized protein (DUF1330 family)
MSKIRLWTDVRSGFQWFDRGSRPRSSPRRHCHELPDPDPQREPTGAAAMSAYLVGLIEQTGDRHWATTDYRPTFERLLEKYGGSMTAAALIEQVEGVPLDEKAAAIWEFPTAEAARSFSRPSYRCGSRSAGSRSSSFPAWMSHRGRRPTPTRRRAEDAESIGFAERSFH